MRCHRLEEESGRMRSIMGMGVWYWGSPRLHTLTRQYVHSSCPSMPWSIHISGQAAPYLCCGWAQGAPGGDGQRLTDVTAPLPPAFVPAPAPCVLSAAVSKTAALMKWHQGPVLN